jgi:putative (di)nucleoside polyphosphate hydrolase
MNAEQLPYRRCVGIMLLNAAGQVWIGRRVPKWDSEQGATALWQMPQGGIDDGEEPAAAALRELEEEVGTRNADIVAEHPRWLTYDLPAEVLGIALKGRYRGQTQKWFALRYRGSDTDFNIDGHGGHEVEFDEWRWAAIDELPQLVVPFKRAVYDQVVAEFRPLTGR